MALTTEPIAAELSPKMHVRILKEFKKPEEAKPDAPVAMPAPLPAAPPITTAPVSGGEKRIPGALIGGRYMTAEDGPIEVDHDTAERLIKDGVAEAMAEAPAAGAHAPVAHQHPPGAKK